MDDDEIEVEYSLKLILLGLAFVAIVAALIAVCILSFKKQFTPTTTVTFVTETVGNSLSREADVKIGGAVVGEVRDLQLAPDGSVEIELALRSDRLDFVPANATARIIPKTLFGERYVEIVAPENPVGIIAAGAVIVEHDEGNAIDAARMYDVFFDLLDAVPPQDLAVTLGALNQALSGRGEAIGNMVDRFGPMVEEINSELPNLEQQLRDLGDVTDVYADAVPDLVAALDTYRTTNATLIESRSAVDGMLDSLSLASADMRGFLDTNGERIVRIAADSRETLELLAQYSPMFGCTAQYFADMGPRIDRVFGGGIDRPGLHLTIQLANPRGGYIPNQDEARFFDTRGPICYEPVHPADGNFPQHPGGAFNTGAYAVPSRNPGPQNLQELPSPLASVGHGGGLFGNADEVDSLRMVYSATTGLAPDDIPGWVTLVGAPVLRGTDVTFAAE
ncbi:MCE family protein [Hoyosella rhizosphaerae]|uniref:ABC transporter substrate-binding protein n=1 Tax=Hoyosella rhizosphaerae TaxID=1755582 RepID=A0A916U7J5_9ACTN|nr:MCE family protein [Hoyosella rhizosphaerae]MBN4927554.1 MCE family protein [Hoyosella rhizosphaerae]GGC63544.1 ABC transporter substrate-binding protein [Hoyosella rhizosphaerae]